MKAEDLYTLMDDPSLLNAETLAPLREIVDEYPYFHVARMLYLKNLEVTGDAQFAEELRKTAVYVPDRKKLFALIEGKRYGITFPLVAGAEDDSADGSFSLIDAFLADREGKEGTLSDDGSGQLHPSVSSDYIYWSLSEEDGPKEHEKPSPRLRHQDLIDEFIKNDEARASERRLPAAVPPQEEPPLPPPSEETENEPSDDGSYFTETLAHIYIKQKRYEKALVIIKNLYLNYPKKNAYFADQIRFLEKLITNTKK